MPTITLTVDAANAARVQAAAADAGAPDVRTWIAGLVSAAVIEAEKTRPPATVVIS